MTRGPYRLEAFILPTWLQFNALSLLCASFLPGAALAHGPQGEVSDSTPSYTESMLAVVNEEPVARYQTRGRCYRPFASPTKGIFSGWSWRYMGSGRWSQHSGIDFHAPIGTPILSATRGVVSAVDYDRFQSLIISVQIAPDDLEWSEGKRMPSYSVSYGHLKEAWVVPGQRIKEGQPIGSSGDSGFTHNIPHLHLTVAEQAGNGASRYHVDPNRFLEFCGGQRGEKLYFDLPSQARRVPSNTPFSKVSQAFMEQHAQAITGSPFPAQAFQIYEVERLMRARQEGDRETAAKVIRGAAKKAKPPSWRDQLQAEDFWYEEEEQNAGGELENLQGLRRDDVHLWAGLRSWSHLCDQLEPMPKIFQQNCAGQYQAMLRLLKQGYKPKTVHAYLTDLRQSCRSYRWFQAHYTQEEDPILSQAFSRWADRCTQVVRHFEASTQQ